MKLAISILTSTFLSVAAFADVANDRTVSERLREALHDSVDDGIRVDVDGGVATLSGQVRSLWAKREAIERTLDMDDILAIEDELEIAHGESDSAVAEAVAREIRRYPFFTVYDDVDIAVADGAVALTGRVTMPFKSNEIERRVSRVMGVQSLDNGIAVLPTSIGDRRLRADLAYRIYGNLMFRDYARRANPPIHIIVERGRVALTGAVRSEVERRQAEIIARQTFGVFAVDNRLTVGD